VYKRTCGLSNAALDRYHGLMSICGIIGTHNALINSGAVL